MIKIWCLKLFNFVSEAVPSISLFFWLGTICSPPARKNCSLGSINFCICQKLGGCRQTFLLGKRYVRSQFANFRTNCGGSSKNWSLSLVEGDPKHGIGGGGKKRTLHEVNMKSLTRNRSLILYPTPTSWSRGPYSWSLCASSGEMTYYSLWYAAIHDILLETC